jgi:2-polyprenyl-6-methoxyphenol hydroxylase-like FAD-dependent oxidoreductase
VTASTPLLQLARNSSAASPSASHAIAADVSHADCCVVGGGPAGAILSLLLARRGVRVTLLEMHKDFDREFRGDTVHPSTLEILDSLGLADRVHQLGRGKIYGPTLATTQGPFVPIDLRVLKTKFPYILMVPQKDLLDLLTEEAAKFPGFQLQMGANVTELMEEDSIVRGVRYQSNDAEGPHEVRATLTVGTDGRFSRIRALGGFTLIRTSPPMDVLWFRLPHLPEDPIAQGGAFGGIGRGHLVIGLDRGDFWQAGYVILKGSYKDIRAQGIGGLCRGIVAIEPRLAKHVESLTDWHQVALLSVESSRCPRWWKPGLLIIGDAAHVMSPIGGVGINYAIQDAVVAANVLTRPLLEGHVRLADLQEVQRQRERPVRFIQFIQTQMQKRIIATVLTSQQQQLLEIPWWVRKLVGSSLLRKIVARAMAYGLVKVRLEN